jgi:hypothetical protein
LNFASNPFSCSILLPPPIMAPSKYKDKDGGVVLAFRGDWISWTHTIVAYSMFPSYQEASGRHLYVMANSFIP